MRFPLKLAAGRCPVCSGPTTPESASLSFTVLTQARGDQRVLFLGSLLMAGWDSGATKSRRSRRTISAAVKVAAGGADEAADGGLELRCCSTACLRMLLNEALDELERRAEVARPEGGGPGEG